ncbi:MAG TPA: hypothetical protein VFZ59_08545 [Verrucomicrobiae bacterium]|nr:hypothetical protein [Verrucomicrobiae bacterium]
MRDAGRTILALLLAVVLMGCGEKHNALSHELTSFVKSKQVQAKALASAQGAKWPASADKLFGAILADKHSAATNLFAQLEREHSNSPVVPAGIQWVKDRLEKIGWYTPSPNAFQTEAWQPLIEAYWAYQNNRTWQRPHLEMAVHEIVNVIPSNSVYFGGTDPGRFAITAAMQSHQDGRPFFVLTQNALADGTYLAYLSSMFSNSIYVPTTTDSQKAFETYLVEAQKRAAAGTLKKAESVAVGGGSVSVSGIGAVMEINALIARVIFDRNPQREFYLEQSWALTWTYPHLVPHGPIFKINREPLDRLTDSMLQDDRAYWSNQCVRLIGNSLAQTASIQSVCDFVEKTYGNPIASEKIQHYLQDKPAQEFFSKLRHSVADVYLWRCSEATETDEKQRMLDECLLAFGQAFALGPGNAQLVGDYIGMLAQIHRFDDAERIARVAGRVNPANASLLQWIAEQRNKARSP